LNAPAKFRAEAYPAASGRISDPQTSIGATESISYALSLINGPENPQLVVDGYVALFCCKPLAMDLRRLAGHQSGQVSAGSDDREPAQGDGVRVSGSAGGHPAGV
jgi:hypothetical protein